MIESPYVDVRYNVRYSWAHDLYCEKIDMQTYTVTQARMDIYNLVAQTELNHEPLQIIGKKNNAILIAESDWNAIQETLYLLSVPGMAESIIQGMNQPLEDCSDTLFDDES